ncbi:MAG: hypothetical protein EBT45_07600, partial [Alphaproteobacteria bacterium]|nr:hypothetical protein [Alphaproteobacteria bacterium]
MKNLAINKSLITDTNTFKFKNVPTMYDGFYDVIYKPDNKPSMIVKEQLASYFTTDVKFLKETQQLMDSLDLEQINKIKNKYGVDSFYFSDVVRNWEEIKNETGFCEKYLYIDWTFAKHLNTVAPFLQMMSLYN